MIYAKIYVDENSNLVFDSVKKDVDGHCEICKKTRRPDGSLLIVPMTEIKPSTNVVISPEAKALFEKWLEPSNPNLAVNKFDGDFELFRNNTPLSRDSGLRFSFRPNKLGETQKILKPSDKFTLCVKFGLDLEVLEDFTKAPNELIKHLDISEPVNESDLSPSSGGPTGPSSN